MPPRVDNQEVDGRLFTALNESKVCREYTAAFSEATDVPVTLLPAGRRPNLVTSAVSTKSCQLMLRNPIGCAGCQNVQERLQAQEGLEPQTLACEFGLSRTAVSVRLEQQLVGLLVTDHVLLQPPSEPQFRRLALLASTRPVAPDEAALRRAYFGARVLTPVKHQAMVRLLEIFAQHLSLLSHRLLMNNTSAEPQAVVRAKDFIRQHLTEPLTLGRVAVAVNTSTFYLCKLFKRSTGLNFTDYLARLRVERARELLLDPNRRIGEVAYAAGFQSLTHFNRVFKRITGQAPGAYRAQFRR